MSSKATIVDVARLAGVSTATVSRVMHNPSVVRPATLERVREVMHDCGYVYNATAGDFSRRKSTVVGVLILSTTTKTDASVNAAQQVAAEKNFPLIISTSLFDPALERRHLEQFLQRGVAGVLIIGHLEANRQLIQELKDRDIPCVFLWEIFPGTQENYVGINNVDATAAMVTHLLSQGHRRIGFICGINAGVERIVMRYEGYKKALAAHDIPLDPSLIRSAISTYANGCSAMESFMSMPEPPRCVCCASDALAVGAIAAVHKAGLRVPEDYCVAGFDNTDISPYMSPTLSTVDVPGEEMGRIGMEKLLALVGDPKAGPFQKELKTSLVLRASTCPASRQRQW
ncbi:LacI family transcriptional regulator [Desulfovibrio sp. OttesenSCG-928-G15]|nr:LacI family transcriptional regulator [Desulfovibrio sp. OttesenSCG-928-G15]